MTLNEHGWIDGDHWVICDVCGFKKRKSQVIEVKGSHRTQQGVVCIKCYDKPHPLDYQRPIKINQKAEPVRTRVINYLPETCYIETRQGVAGKGIAGCMKAGYNLNL